MDKKYFAFISYSHKDKKAADWIHKKLTFYRLPSYAREELKRDIRLRPICRDEHSLPPGPLWEMLKSKLDESRYVIVICSPNSAKPGLDGEHWVNREVEYFAEKYGEDRIIPVIIEGKPNDAEKECFCPELQKRNILALDMTGKGASRQKSLTFLAAKLLGLNPDMLWRYDEQEKRKDWKKRLLCFLPLLLVMLIGLAFVIDNNRLVVNYYADYVDSYGLPEGIYPLTADQLPERYIHYRFEYQGYRLGKSIHHDSSDWSFFRLFGLQRVLRRVVQANSVGNPMERNHTELGHRPSIQVFNYDNDLSFYAKKLIRITYRNPGGKDGLIKQILLLHDRGNVINGKVELRTPNNDPKRQQARLTTSKDDMDQTKWHGKHLSTITGYHLERDSKGRAIRTINVDPFGTPTPDADGILAFEYKLDDKGRITEKWYLEKQGNDWSRKPNTDQVAGVIYRYRGANMESTKYVNKNSTPIMGPHGWMICEEQFDDNGNCVFEIYKDKDGRVALHEINKVAGYIASYKNGNLVTTQAHSGEKDENGQWIHAMVWEYTDASKKELKESYSSQHVTYNQDGYIETCTNKNLNGDICVRISQNWAILKREYEIGKISHEYYYDKEEAPGTDNNGIHHVHIEYHPETGEECKRTLYALDKQGGVWNNKDVHKVIQNFDANGNITSVHHFSVGTDENKPQPVADQNGIASIKIQYHANGKEKRRDLFAPKNTTKGIWNNPGVMHVVQLFDENGKQIEQRYYASEDETVPVADQSNILYGTIQYHSNGKIKRMDLFASPNAAKGIWNKPGVMHVVQLFDENGKQIEERYYASDDESKPIADRDNMLYGTIQYHSNGKIKRMDLFASPNAAKGIENKPGVMHVVRLFDENENKIEEKYYASQDEATPVADQDGVTAYKIQYHSNGKIKRRDLFAPPNATWGLLGIPGVMHVVRLFDENEKLIEEKYYASQDESTPVADQDGVTAYKIQYHSNEKRKRRDLFAPQNTAKGIWNNPGVMHVVQLFDENGKQIEQRYYASEDETVPVADQSNILYGTIQYHSNGNEKRRDLFAPQNTAKGIWNNPGVMHVVQLFDENGKQIEQRYYASQDESTPVADQNGVAAHKSQYHANGKEKRRDSFAPPNADKGIWNLHGVIHMVQLYDENGKLIEEKYYASQDEATPVADQDGVAAYKIQYHANGKIKRRDLFALSDSTTGIWKTLAVRHVVQIYDENGRLIEQRYYATQDESQPAEDDNGAVKGTIRNNANGFAIEIITYDKENNVRSHARSLVIAGAVISSSEAEKSGIKTGDVVLNYAGKDLSNRYEDIDKTIAQFKDKEKTLIFAREQADGSYLIFAHTFPAGTMGIQIQKTWFEINKYNKILEAYKNFRTK